MARGVVEATAADNEFREKTVTFRGRSYHMRELPIGEYDKIAKLATSKVEINGVEVDRLDDQVQSRLLLDKMMIDVDPPLPRSGITGLGTGVVIGLNRVVNELLYADEKDESSPTPAAPAEDDEEAAAPAPNA